MSESKIQVKVGIVEFSGEGNQDWLAKQLDKILEKVPELLKIEVAAPGHVNNATNNGTTPNGNPTGLSLINVAGKLNCKSGSDLVIAAAAYMHFTLNQKTFTRDDINGTMKKATGYYKNSVSANLTTTLASLEKNNTFSKTSNAYSFHVDKANELNAILSK